MNHRLAVLLLAALALAAALLLLSSRGDSAADGDGERSGQPQSIEAARADDAAESQHGLEVQRQPLGDGAASATSCEVRGRVMLEHDQPAVHAIVWVDLEDGARADADCGALGAFSITLPAGRHRLHARGEATGTTTLPLAIDAAETSRDVGRIELDRGGLIAGRIVGEDGAPLADVEVRAALEDGSARSFHGGGGLVFTIGRDATRTDRDGRFELAGLDRGAPHRVQLPLAVDPAFEVEPREFRNVQPGGLPLAFRVTSRYAVAGRVIDAVTRKPLHPVSISGAMFDNEDGTFEMTFVRRDFVLVDSPSHFQKVQGGLDRLTALERRSLEIELAPAGEPRRLALTVLDDRRQPLRDCWLRFQHGLAWQQHLRLDAGKAEVEFPWGYGTLNTLVWAEGHVSRKDVLDPDRATSATLVLQRAAPVELQIEDAEGGSWSGDVALAAGNGRGPRWRYVDLTGTLLDNNLPHTQPRGVEIGESDRPQSLSLGRAHGRIEDLAPGMYELRVFFDAEPKRVPFEVTAETPRIVRVGP